MIQKIANYLGLQLGWLACAWGAATQRWWLGPLVVAAHLALYFYWSENRRADARLVLSAAVIGLVVDSLKKAAGFISYESPVPGLWWMAPAWIIAMWALFATTLTTSLSWLQERYVLAALLGAAGGPLSYYAGVQLGAITFLYPTWVTLAVLALVWGAVTPLLAGLARNLQIT